MIGYGQDTWCLDELSLGRLATGRMALVQALYRRLTTPRGVLRHAGNPLAYGIDLANYVGAVGTRLAVAAVPSLIEGELRKDDRVASVAAQARFDHASETLVIEVDVMPVDATEDFRLTFRLSEDSLTLLGVS